MPAPPAAESWRFSLPLHPEQHRTGAVWLDEDPRDYPFGHNPEIRAVKAVGAPAAADNSASVLGIYDQGQEGSCVSWSDCSAVSTEGVIAGGDWRVLDGETFYHELGGTGQNGVDTRASLQRAVDLGIPLANSAARVRIGSYFFASRDPAQFILDCEAAVAARKCVVVAMLLPSPYSWDSGEVVTQGYHQQDLVGYDPVWWTFAGSWGRGAGRNGFFRIKKSFVVASNMQNGYAYAATVDFLLLPPPPPPPPVVLTRTVSALATGNGLSTLAVGQDIEGQTQQGFNGKLKITQINDGGPNPPPPAQLTVSGYQPASVTGGQPFTILGSGFAAGPGVTYNNQTLRVTSFSDSQINTAAPVIPGGFSAPVVVTVGGVSVTGPLLTIGDGGPPPPPVGDLLVSLTPIRGHWLSVVVQDNATKEYLTAQCHLTVGGVDLGTHQTIKQGATALSARFYYGSATGTAVVNAASEDNRTGQGSITV